MLGSLSLRTHSKHLDRSNETVYSDKLEFAVCCRDAERRTWRLGVGQVLFSLEFEETKGNWLVLVGQSCLIDH